MISLFGTRKARRTIRRGRWFKEMAREGQAAKGKGGGEKGEDFAELVGRLCARCEALSREARGLRAENRRLRSRGAEAKSRLERLLLTLPRE